MMYQGLALYSMLAAYKEGKLQEIWQNETRLMIALDRKLSTQRAGELAAARLQGQLATEYTRLSEKYRYANETDMLKPDCQLLDWLMTEDNTGWAAYLIEWSGSRTLWPDVDLFQS